MSYPRRSRNFNSDINQNAYLRPLNAEPTLYITAEDYPSDFDLDFSRVNVIRRIAECSRIRRLTGTLLELEETQKCSDRSLLVAGKCLAQKRQNVDKNHISAPLKTINPYNVPTKWIFPEKRIEESLEEFLNLKNEKPKESISPTIPKVIRLYLGLEQPDFAIESWRKDLVCDKVTSVSAYDKTLDWLRFGHQ